MISKYIARALERAVYVEVDGHSYCASVRGLRGVLATGESIEECRRQLAEVIEEWILVRVARHLPVPKLGGITIRVRRAG
jgi:predicted RNase H-like HicB family nuclease